MISLKIGNKKLVIERQEYDCENPRDWDNLGKFVLFHKRYTLANETDITEEQFNSWEELEKHLTKKLNAVVLLPIYMYDHSGISIKVGSFNGLLPQGHAEFDSGKIGYIFLTRDAWNREGITKQKAKVILQNEVKTYNSYLNGEVYGYTLSKIVKCKCCNNISEEHIDSCWGFLGDIRESGILDNIPDVFAKKIKTGDYEEVKE